MPTEVSCCSPLWGMALLAFPKAGTPTAGVAGAQLQAIAGSSVDILVAPLVAWAAAGWVLGPAQMQANDKHANPLRKHATWLNAACDVPAASLLHHLHSQLSSCPDRVTLRHVPVALWGVGVFRYLASRLAARHLQRHSPVTCLSFVAIGLCCGR